jgi:hypothetical protein
VLAFPRHPRPARELNNRLLRTLPDIRAVSAPRSRLSRRAERSRNRSRRDSRARPTITLLTHHFEYSQRGERGKEVLYQAEEADLVIHNNFLVGETVYSS